VKLKQLCLDFRGKVWIKTVLPHEVLGHGLQIDVRRDSGHSVTTAFTRFRGRSTSYPFFVATW